MTPPPSEPEPFPSSDFDVWAAEYDEDVFSEVFPFTGYRGVLAEVVRLADARVGMSVLDLGTGTGNLAEQFSRLGCEVWGTDFSSEMLERAREKLPSAYFYLHDLRQPFPNPLQRRFDRIVSAYVFHHFELDEKVAIVEHLARERLARDGRLMVADISFPTRQTLDAVREAMGDEWEDELYWIAADSLPALEAIGVDVSYVQVSNCAGVYQITKEI